MRSEFSRTASDPRLVDRPRSKTRVVPASVPGGCDFRIRKLLGNSDSADLRRRSSSTGMLQRDRGERGQRRESTPHAPPFDDVLSSVSSETSIGDVLLSDYAFGSSFSKVHKKIGSRWHLQGSEANANEERASSSTSRDDPQQFIPEVEAELLGCTGFRPFEQQDPLPAAGCLVESSRSEEDIARNDPPSNELSPSTPPGTRKPHKSVPQQRRKSAPQPAAVPQVLLPLPETAPVYFGFGQQGEEHSASRSPSPFLDAPSSSSPKAKSPKSPPLLRGRF